MKPNSISQKKQKKQKLKKKEQLTSRDNRKAEKNSIHNPNYWTFWGFFGHCWKLRSFTPLYLSLPNSWLNIKKAHCVKGTLGSSEIPRQCDNSSVTKNCSVEVSIIMLNYHTKKQSQATIKPFWRYSMLKHEAMAERRLSS